MSEMINTWNRNLTPVQAAELALLVDLEARWENMRTTAAKSSARPPTLLELQNKQKAYEAFRTKLAAYNQRFAPGHVPELLLNTPTRLGLWCRAMRELYLRIEDEPQGHCPAHLLEKAYRCADRVAARIGKGPVNRSTPPSSIQATVQELEALGRWCEDLAGAGLASGQLNRSSLSPHDQPE
jgi:hypothetical protein